MAAVDPQTGKPKKWASAHDLRRAFGTRWAKRVMPAVLKELMRHADIATTMQFYVDQDARETAADLWREHKAAGYHSGYHSPASGGEAEETEAAPHRPK